MEKYFVFKITSDVIDDCLEEALDRVDNISERIKISPDNQ